MTNPATAGRMQGSMQFASLVASDAIDTLSAPSSQHRIADRLTRRFGMSPPLARVVVELAGMGGPHG